MAEGSWMNYIPMRKHSRPGSCILSCQADYTFSTFGVKAHARPNSRAKAIWDLEGIFCSSRHIPHVRFPGLIHPGILGTAPSPEILAEWNRREAELVASFTNPGREIALPPQPQNVHAGSASDEIKAKVGREGARTVPGRPERKHIAKVLFPPGAMLTPHFT